MGEALGVPSGGERTGAIYEHRLELVIDADLEKMFGWTGTAFHANGYWIYGPEGLSRNYIGNILPISSIEALPSTRLYEAWFEKKFGDKVAVRFGQLAADTEFILTKYGAIFINGSYSWPGIASSDLPSGGPAYPLATPGVRVKFTPSDQFAFLLGLYNGDPAGPGTGDPQRRDRYGLNFRIADPPLLFGETQINYSLNQDLGLAGTVKVGGWNHFGRFTSPLYDVNGVSLADPASSGLAQRLRGDDGVYAILDQMIYHVPKADPSSGVGVFARIMGAPADRNLVDFYADGGVNFSGMIPGRPNDSFGAAVAYAHISHSYSAYESQLDAFTNVSAPVQNYEANLELTYMYQAIPGFLIQPDLQYIVHPGGNIANPFGNGVAPIPNALVVGVRATINY